MEAGLQTLGGGGRTALPDGIYRMDPAVSPDVAGMQAGGSNVSGGSTQRPNMSAHSPASDSLPSPRQRQHWFHGSGKREGSGRASSLSSAFSGFSRGIRRGRRDDRIGGKKSKDDMDDDDDDDVILEGDSTNIVTYQDLNFLRNNGGNKYGYGVAMDDSTPIIPTVVTKEHKNMNNIEYRKHIISQKKMALNMAARQNRMQEAGAPRALSLQTIGPKSSFDQSAPGGVPTHPGTYMQQPYGSRANYLATTTVGGARYRPDVPPFGMQYSPLGPAHGQSPLQRPNGGKAMSFTGRVSYARMASPYGAPAGPRALSPDPNGLQYPQQQPPLNYRGPKHPQYNYKSPQPIPRQYPQQAPQQYQQQFQQQYPQQQYQPQYPQQYHQQQILVGPRSNSFQGLARVMPEHIRQPPALSAPPMTPGSFSPQASTVSVEVDSLTRSNGGTPDSTELREGDEQERTLPMKSPLHQETQCNRTSVAEGRLNVVKLADQKQCEMQLATIQERDNHEIPSPRKDGRGYDVPVDQMDADAPKAEAIGGQVEEQSPDVATGPDVAKLNVKPSNLLVDSLRAFDGDDSLDLSKDDYSFPWLKKSLASGPDSRTSESEGSSSAKPALSLNAPELGAEASISKRDESAGLYQSKTSGNNTFLSAVELPETLASNTLIKEPSFEEKNSDAPQLARIWRVAGNSKDVKENGFMKAKNFLRKISAGRSKNRSGTESSLSPALQTVNTSVNNKVNVKRDSASSSSKSLKSGDIGVVEKRKNSRTSIDSRAHKVDSIKSTPLRKHRSFQSLFSGTSTPTQRLKSSSTASVCSEDRSIRSQSISEAHGEHPHTAAGATYSNSSGSTSQTGKQSKIYQHEGSSEAHLDSGNTSDSSVLENLYVPSFAKGIAELEPAMILSTSSRGRKFQTITISPEQMNIVASNKELMNDVHIISQELAQSIAREAHLEQQLYSKHNKSSESNSFCVMDFEVELRKKSAKIVELIQALNEERLKRFIAEEQVLLAENGAKPNNLDLVYKINLLQKELEVKNNEIRQLRERIAAN